MVAAWGWRIPFLLGLLAAVFGHVVKDSVQDSAETQAAIADRQTGAAKAPNPLRVAFVTHLSTTMIVAGVACFWPTAFYIAFVCKCSPLEQGVRGARPHPLFCRTFSIILAPSPVVLGPT